VVCLISVITKPRNEEAQAHEQGLLSHKKIYIYIIKKDVIQYFILTDRTTTLNI
jgi:hypothetical protein